MSDYESIHGTRVKYLTSDPTLESSYEGQVWYNSTSGTNKALVQIKAWSSGANLSTSRHEVSGFGTQTASVAVGGYDQLFPGGTPPIGNLLTSVEEYSGFTWAGGTALPVASTQYCRAGTQTAGLISFAMRAPVPTSPSSAVSFEYDGSSWTTGGTGNKARRLASGNGTQTAAIAAGGFNNPDSPQSLNNSESYDGSSWTATNTLNVTGFNHNGAGAGTSTANIIITRTPSTPTFGQVSEWDGTNWTSGTSLNTARGDVGLDGIQTNALAFGGTTPPVSNATEQWDGSTWNTSSNMSTARSGFAGSGGTNASYAALAAGGNIGTGVTNVTEEYNSNINAITNASLSSGGNLSTARTGLGGAGLQDSGLGFGGYLAPGVSNSTEEYGGSSWTAGGNLGTARAELCGSGTQTAAWANGGFSPSSSLHLNTEEYDGSSWTAVNNSNSSLRARGDAGTQTAGLMYAGFPSSNVTEEYNGTTWTVVNSMVGTAGYKKGWGTQTAATSAGNSSDGGPAGTSVTGIQSEDYDGTSWTANSSLNLDGRVKMTVGQTGSLGAATGGRSEPSGTVRSVVEEWNGTSWKSAATLSTARFNGSNGIGTKAAGLFAGGSTPSKSNATEEYTGETEIITASTLTTS